MNIPSDLQAYVDYDGSVGLETQTERPLPFDHRIRLGLDNKFRGQSFPVQQLNGEWVIVFPFGAYYLTLKDFS